MNKFVTDCKSAEVPVRRKVTLLEKKDRVEILVDGTPIAGLYNNGAFSTYFFARLELDALGLQAELKPTGGCPRVRIN